MEDTQLVGAFSSHGIKSQEEKDGNPNNRANAAILLSLYTFNSRMFSFIIVFKLTERDNKKNRHRSRLDNYKLQEKK